MKYDTYIHTIHIYKELVCTEERGISSVGFEEGFKEEVAC